MGLLGILATSALFFMAGCGQTSPPSPLATAQDKINLSYLVGQQFNAGSGNIESSGIQSASLRTHSHSFSGSTTFNYMGKTYTATNGVVTIDGVSYTLQYLQDSEGFHGVALSAGSHILQEAISPTYSTQSSYTASSSESGNQYVYSVTDFDATFNLINAGTAFAQLLITDGTMRLVATLTPVTYSARVNWPFSVTIQGQTYTGTFVIDYEGTTSFSTLTATSDLYKNGSKIGKLTLDGNGKFAAQVYTDEARTQLETLIAVTF